MAGGAHGRAGAAAVAAHAEGGEQRIVEVGVDPVAHGLGVDLEVAGDAYPGRGALVVGLPAAVLLAAVAGAKRALWASAKARPLSVVASKR